MKKWEKIEDIVNAKLERTLDSAGDLISGKTPLRLREWKDQTKQKIDQQISKTKESVLQAPASLAKNIHNARDNATEKVHNARVNFHEKLSDSKQPAVIAIFLILAQWTIIPLYKKIALLLQGMQPATMATTIIMTTVTSLVGIGVYTSGDKIAQEAGLIEREPAAVEIVRELRPRYYKRNERELLVANITIPAYIEGVNDYKKLQVDFSIISSNRYIREFFYDHTHLVEDVFNSKVEAMIPGFPLGDEGKRILKSKIKLELNELLKRMKIDGSIDEVYISSILAG